jgi:hypothetical protein
VNNTCGSSGSSFWGVIYVEGAHTFTHGVFQSNSIDGGAAIGFGSSGSVTLSNWLIDEELTTSGSGQVSASGAGTVRLSGATAPAICPFTIAIPTASLDRTATAAITQTASPEQTPSGTRPETEAMSGSFTAAWSAVLRPRRMIEVWIFTVWWTEF